MACSILAAPWKPYLGPKGQPTWIKRASAPDLQGLLVPHLQIETYPLLLTLMNLMVSWHAKFTAICSVGSMPMLKVVSSVQMGRAMDSHQREDWKVGPANAGTPYLQEDFLVVNKAT